MWAGRREDPGGDGQWEEENPATNKGNTDTVQAVTQVGPVPHFRTMNELKNPATTKKAGIRKVWMRLTSQPNHVFDCGSW